MCNRNKPTTFLKRSFVAACLFFFLALRCAGQVGFGNAGGITTTTGSLPYLTGTQASGTTSLPLLNGSMSLGWAATDGTVDPNNPPVIVDVITLSLLEETSYIIPNGFSATVGLSIKTGVDQTSAQNTTAVLTSINVTYNAGAGQTYKSKNYLTFTGVKYVIVKVTSITATIPVSGGGSQTQTITTLPGSGADVSQVLKLENEMQVTNYYLLTPAIPTVTASNPVASGGIEQDELPVSWTWPPSTVGNGYTQIEWTWLEDELLNTYPNAAGIVTNTALLFANNATRVDIPEGLNHDTYNIPLLYDGTGHLYFRLRAVNYLPNGGITTGPWYTTGDPNSTGMPAPVPFDGHNNSLNWQATISFAEDGKRKSVVQYFDGSLRGRQTVTKDNSTNTIVTAETFYDQQGRPAIQILPAPGIDNIIAYRQNLNLFNSQTAGSDPAYFFDLPVGTATPDLRLQTTTTDGASQYYSSNNPGLTSTHPNTVINVPDAGGYPYSQTVYTPDATGRIAAQGGVGPNFQIGSGHETKYFYGTPLQEELDGLFGTEVGYKEHYFKNVVVDANGQASVSYVDMHGRTIATALAGSVPPPGMKAINNATDYPNQGGTNIINSNLIANGSNTVKDNTTESVTAILVTDPTTNYSFNYLLPGGAYTYTNCAGSTVSYPFVYDLELAMINEATGAVVFDFTYPGINSENTPTTIVSPNGTPLTASQAGINANQMGITVANVTSLAVGSYLVRKTLTLRLDKMQSYLQQYLTVGNGVCSALETNISNNFQAVQNASGCAVAGYINTNNVCLEISQPGSTNQPSGQQHYINNYYNRLGVTSSTATAAQQAAALAAYNAQVSFCNGQYNNPVSHRLDDIQAAMMADLVPFSGQYAANPIANANTAAPYSWSNCVNCSNLPTPIQAYTPGIISPVTGSLVAPSTADNMFQKYNIFTATVSNGAAQVPEYQYPSSTITGTNVYLNNAGSPDASMPQTTLTSATPASFSQEFSLSWQQSLLPYHPEYKKLQFAQSNQAAFYDWVDAGLFYQTKTMATAIQNGFVNADITNVDPFFAINDPLVNGTQQSPASYLSTMRLNMWSDFTNTTPKLINFWQQAFSAVVYANDADDPTRQADVNTNVPYFPPALQNIAGPNGPILTPAMITEWYNVIYAADQTQADLVWNKFKQLYLNYREQLVNQYINASRPLPQETDGTNDDDDLVAQGFVLHFPKSTDQAVQQSGGSTASTQTSPATGQWYTPQDPTNPGSNAPAAGSLTTALTQNNINVALGYVPIWTNELLENSLIAQSSSSSAIVAAIIGTVDPTGGTHGTGFLGVCQNSVNEAHLGGATSAPVANANGYTNFEQVFNAVISQYGLSLGINCNPYVIQFPKPLGASPSITDQETGIVNTCMCGEYATMLGQAETADPNIIAGGTINLTELNNYLTTKYGQPISAALFAGLQSCGNASGSSLPTVTIDNTTTPATTYQAYTLPGPQPLPQYLQCGYQAVPQTLTCDKINSLSSTFVSLFALPSPYTTVPLVPANNAPLAQSDVAYNTLWENYLNYQTGLQYDWGVYAQALASAQPACPIVICPVGTVPIHVEVNGIGADQPTGGYVAGQSVDFETGFSFTATSTSGLNAIVEPNATACGGGSGQTVIGPALQALNQANIIVLKDPCQSRYDLVAQQATHDYLNLLNQLTNSFTQQYTSHGLATNETFTVNYTTAEYHYTLYYYDMAGNLVKTVPPKGVEPNFTLSYTGAVDATRNAAVSNGGVYPAPGSSTTPPTPPAPTHALTTNYRYNSLNQVVAQNTPDAGTSLFWYDALGRLAVSQNAKQYADAAANSGMANYSYTLYDALGRIAEVGQKPQTVAMVQAISQDANPTSDALSLAYWLATDGTSQKFVANKQQITRTTYDVAYQPLASDAGGQNALAGNAPLINQQNLRNRVSYTEVFNVEPDGWLNGYDNQNTPDFTAYHASAQYYTYDIHGNVGTLLQDYGSGSGTPNPMNQSGGGNRFKVMQYNYDLISGKVNMVAYQPPYVDASNIVHIYPDAFYHKYSYDAENRLIEVETSLDNVHYERDARYAYYAHGPLRQTTIGKLQVQQLNYTYTVQGWLKNVNAAWEGNTITPTGSTPAPVVAYSLHYYNPAGSQPGGDYTPIGGTQAAATAIYNGVGSALAPLYNGNIAAMAVSINVPGLQAGSSNINNPMVYNYGYDQLNRIVSMGAYTSTSNTFATVTSVNDYAEAVTYDPNGNIVSYTRNGFGSPAGTASQIDNLTYTYTAGTNRLDNISDQDGAHTGMGDIGTQSAGNYTYDAIGNLTGNAADGIGHHTAGASQGDGITWSVYGKISSITKTDVNNNVTATINYTYDVAGNRISKAVTQGGATITTWYVRDASGNVMSIYTAGNTNVCSGDLTQTEAPMYGSGRLGELKPNTDVQNFNLITVALQNSVVAVSTPFVRGQKFFELSNHLGNVLATVSDRLIPVANSNNNGQIASYYADVVTAQDYYPFGMPEPGRQFNAASGTGYRYGFNGKENDNDIDAGVQDYGMRIYDGRIGRFLSVDPMGKKFPFYTPYQFAGDKPIWCIDLDGLEDVTANRAQGKAGEAFVRTKLKVGTSFDVYEQVTTRPVGADKTSNSVNDFFLFSEDDGLFYKLEIKTGKAEPSKNQVITDNSISNSDLSEMRSATNKVGGLVKTGGQLTYGASVTVRIEDPQNPVAQIENVVLNPKTSTALRQVDKIRELLKDTKNAELAVEASNVKLTQIPDEDIDIACIEIAPNLSTEGAKAAAMDADAEEIEKQQHDDNQNQQNDIEPE